MTDLWQACRGGLEPQNLSGRLLRMVESQERVATTNLVDDLAEQALLEQLLEETKPPLPDATRGRHYLLATPFRYPPLHHGSRFGTRHEPSLFYGSRTLITVLAETAYYRLLFWSGMVEPPPAGRYLTQHSLFATSYRTEKGLRLQGPPCDRYRETLTSPDHYGPTQALGGALRETGIQAFEYPSARDRKGGINLALFSPQALHGRKPLFQEQWLCETRADQVCFTGRLNEVHCYPLEDFLHQGALPSPAI